eukprot:TRINITY_DN109664_c0_g1_i1.p1 TRINITY_DN109664_c0_g1~~TRINITY_DN109664_c0_g1_i1.p1  ORF type:complete len:621 (+),score=90.79 TRINITY_DN109664_c0_g1_i1:119-1981(+)
MGCCQCAPITGVRTAFSTLENVTWAPAEKPGKPTFIEKFVFWRNSSLGLACLMGVMYSVIYLAVLSRKVQSTQDQVTILPKFVRRYLQSFLYAELACESISELMACVGTCMLLAAWSNRQNFKHSSKTLRNAWVINFAAPFAIFLLVPGTFFFSSHVLQRDICAVTIGTFKQDRLIGSFLAEAAKSVGQSELASVLTSPGAPLSVDELTANSPTTDWCRKHRPVWARIVFGEEWLKNSVGSVGEGDRNSAISIPNVFSGMYPGVIPRVFFTVADVFGVDRHFSFCKKKTHQMKQAEVKKMRVSESSLLEQGQTQYQHVDSPESERASQRFLRRESRPKKRHVSVSLEMDYLGSANHVQNKSPVEGKVSNKLPVAENVALNSLCATKHLAVSMAKATTYSHIFAKLALSTYAAVSQAPMITLALGAVDGVATGVKNVKMVLKSSSLPGYLLLLVTMGALPATCYCLMFLSQLGGNPAWSLAIVCFTFSRVLDLYTAEALIKERKKKKIEKTQKAIATAALVAKVAAAVCFIGYLVWQIYGAGLDAAVGLAGIQEFVAEFFGDVAGLVKLVSRTLYSQLVTKLVTSNLVIEAIFDSADDDLKSKGEDMEHIMESWEKLKSSK